MKGMAIAFMLMQIVVALHIFRRMNLWPHWNNRLGLAALTLHIMALVISAMEVA